MIQVTLTIGIIAMPSKMNRANFMQQTNIDGNIENDLAFNNFDSFKFKRPRIYFTITEKYIGRPDLISLDMLGKIDYWWVIMKMNGLDDMYNDFEQGDVIQIPALADVEEFFIQTRRKVDQNL